MSFRPHHKSQVNNKNFPHRSFELFHHTMLFSSLVLFTLLPVVFGQSCQQYLDGLVQAFNSQNLTSLASASATLNGSSEGQRVVQAISQGNWTLFAPNNAAISSATANLSSLNASDVGNLLSYHFVSGNYTALTPAYPNITLGRTLLNASSLVQLEGNKSQVLAWSKGDTGLFALNNGTITSVVNTTKWNNLQVNTIESILQPPPNMTWIFDNSTYNLSNVADAFSSVTILDDNSTTFLDLVVNVHGITLFAPIDSAFAAGGSRLSSIAQANSSALISLFGNHIINSQTVYSPGFWRKRVNYTSASGELFNFTTNSSGAYVSSGGSNTARIVRSDVLASNGVVHIIDDILWDTNINPAAASSAFQSATSVAAASPTTETGPVDATSSTIADGGGSGAAVTVHDSTYALVMAGAVFILTLIERIV